MDGDDTAIASFNSESAAWSNLNKQKDEIKIFIGKKKVKVKKEDITIIKKIY